MIEEIQVGDKVRGFNVEAGKWGTYAVTELQSRTDMMGFYVVNKKLRVSPAHHVLVNGERKVPGEIRLNDILIDGGKETVVTSLEYFDQKADRYNIVLGRNKDVVFMVNDILVWNGW